MTSAPDGSQAATPVFVVGMPRSGTTWVMRLLAAHPEAWPLFETYMFSPYRGLGALLRDVPDDQPDIPLEAIELAPSGLGRIFTRAELIAELRTLAERWLDRATPPGTEFVVEKSPWHLSQVELIAEVLPRARFVNVVRDGRDVAVSLAAARQSWSRAEPDATGAGALSEAAREWQRAIDEAENAKAVAGEALLEVRFERLKADPGAECAALFDHCGMEHDPALVAAAVAAASFESRPEPKGEGRPLRGGRVGDWHDRIGIRDAYEFERRAGRALRKTGYEPNPRWWLRRPLRSRL